MLFGVWVSNFTHCCCSRWGKTLIYDPIWTQLCQRGFCVLLLASRIRTEHHLCGRFLARHPFFNDRTQRSVQCQRSSLNNIITWPEREDENRYQLPIQLLASVVQPWNCCSGYICYRINSKYHGSVTVSTVSLCFFCCLPSQKEIFTITQAWTFWKQSTLCPDLSKKWTDLETEANNKGDFLQCLATQLKSSLQRVAGSLCFFTP